MSFTPPSTKACGGANDYQRLTSCVRRRSLRQVRGKVCASNFFGLVRSGVCGSGIVGSVSAGAKRLLGASTGFCTVRIDPSRGRLRTVNGARRRRTRTVGQCVQRIFVPRCTGGFGGKLSRTSVGFCKGVRFSHDHSSGRLGVRYRLVIDQGSRTGGGGLSPLAGRGGAGGKMVGNNFSHIGLFRRTRRNFSGLFNCGHRLSRSFRCSGAVGGKDVSSGLGVRRRRLGRPGRCFANRGGGRAFRPDRGRGGVSYGLSGGRGGRRSFGRMGDGAKGSLLSVFSLESDGGCSTASTRRLRSRGHGGGGGGKVEQ